eukprot:10466755-Heterocapsa_arctica.AAC.1
MPPLGRESISTRTRASTRDIFCREPSRRCNGSWQPEGRRTSRHRPCRSAGLSTTSPRSSPWRTPKRRPGRTSCAR